MCREGEWMKRANVAVKRAAVWERDEYSSEFVERVLGAVGVLERYCAGLKEESHAALKVRRQCVRCLANVALNGYGARVGLEEDRVREWRRSGDAKLAAEAGRFKANVTQVDGVVYEDRILPVLDLVRPVMVDIVLLHGLQGSVLRTWRGVRGQSRASDLAKSETIDAQGGGGVVPLVVTKDKKHRMEVWPAQWLVPELLDAGVGARVIAVGYDADTRAGKHGRNLEEVGAIVAQGLDRARVGANNRPVLFLTHSLGGLITKTALLHAANSSSQSSKTTLLSSPTAVVFCGTPHFGSPIASLTAPAIDAAVPVSYFELNPLVRLLQRDHPALVKLNRDFQIKCVRGSGSLHLQPSQTPIQSTFHPSSSTRTVRAISLWEGLDDDVGLPRNIRIVPPDSADPGFGDFVEIPHTDHVHVCKPDNTKDDPRFTIVRDVALKLAETTKTKKW